jgi:hypothetical protein
MQAMKAIQMRLFHKAIWAYGIISIFLYVLMQTSLQIVSNHFKKLKALKKKQEENNYLSNLITTLLICEKTSCFQAK